jgi:tRNA/rRNA methyltransferase
MAGTDTSRALDAVPEGPVFVLVRPQLGENVGAAARAMWNFGLRGLRLVDPRDGWPNPRAVAMASGAGSLLDEARVTADVPAAIADCGYVYATTARPRELTRPVLSPEAAVADMRARIAGGARVAVLFGPERTGLENEDVGLANAIVTVDANPAFASINLAQATLLVAYEWRKQAAGPQPAPIPPQAPAGEVAQMLAHLAAELDAAHYFWPEGKRPAMLETLQGIFRRAPLSEQDVRTLRGVLRALAEGPRRLRQGVRRKPADCADMEQLREAIDAVDRALVALFAARTGYIERAAELKRGAGLPARIPDRVEEVVARVRASAQAAGLDPDLYEVLWRRVIEAAIALEERRLAD